MANRKKIILFIVEGINDKTNLALCLSQILSSNEVRFEMTDGDISTRRGVTAMNIVAQIGNLVKKFSGRIFKQSDFLEVVHLVDMDGAFIPDDNIEEIDTQEIEYGTDRILTDNKDKTKSSETGNFGKNDWIIESMGEYTI